MREILNRIDRWMFRIRRMMIGIRRRLCDPPDFLDVMEQNLDGCW